MADLIQAGQKNAADLKGAAVIVESYVSSDATETQVGLDIQMDPIALGNKALSSGAGQPLRLAELAPAAQKTVWVEQAAYLEPGEVKVWAKQDVPADMPAPLVIAIGDRPGSEDLGGVANTPSTDNNDDVHKIVVTGVSNIKSDIITAIHGNGSDARYSTWVENSNHIAITPDGVIHVTYNNKVGSAVNAYHAYSSDGGKTWTIERLDDSYNGMQIFSSVDIDKNGKLYFMWAEYVAADTSRRRLLLRTKSLDGAFGSIEQVSEDLFNGPYNVEPCMAFQPDGVTLGIAWGGEGHEHDSIQAALNILYRTRSSAGVYSDVEEVTTDAKYTLLPEVMYRRVTLQYDSNSKPHVVFFGYGTAPANVYYSNKVGAAWLAKEQVNSDHDDEGTLNTNIIIDSSNTVHVGYLYDDGTQKNLIYKTRSSAGVWSASITIEEKVNVCQMQMSENGDVVFCIPTKNYTADYSLVYKVLNRLGTLSAAVTVDSRTGYDVLTGMTLWGNPTVNGIRRNTPQQGNIFVYTVYTAGDVEHCDLVFFASSNAIIGSPVAPVSIKSFVTRRRGYIEVEKKELIGMPLIK